jgi:hypothetical protein
VVADYRYYCGDLRTDGVIAEIPMFGTYMDLELGKGGSFNGTFNLDQTGKRNSDLLDATVPGHNFIMVERNGVVIWGGILWSRTYQSQSKTAQLFGTSFETYPDHQIIDSDLVISPDDQRNVFCKVWNAMQAGEGRNLGITIPPATFPVVVGASADVPATDMKYFGELMSEIADKVNGFDWYIQCSRIGNAYVKNLVLGYPFLGATASPTSTVFEYPGSITNYYQVESIAESATRVYVPGSGDGSSMILGVADSTLVQTAGWPRWDFISPRKEVLDQSTADALAAQELINRLAPKTTMKATMKGDSNPEFGAWGLGDSVRVVVKDARNPTGLSFSARIAKWTLNPPTGTNVEEYGLIFVGDESG